MTLEPFRAMNLNGKLGKGLLDVSIAIGFIVLGDLALSGESLATHPASQIDPSPSAPAFSPNWHRPRLRLSQQPRPSSRRRPSPAVSGESLATHPASLIDSFAVAIFIVIDFARRN